MIGFIPPKLELAICKAIRDQVESALRWRKRDGEVIEPYLQGGGEMRVWLAVQEAIEGDGWKIVPKTPDGETI